MRSRRETELPRTSKTKIRRTEGGVATGDWRLVGRKGGRWKVEGGKRNGMD